MRSPQWRSIALHVGTFTTGIVAAVSAMASSGVDIYAAYQHAYTGVKELMAAWAILGPAVFIGGGAYYASTRSKLKDVAAAAKDDPAARAAAVAMVDAMPEVAKVITKATPAGEALALAVPSRTVMAASDPQAKL